MLDYELEIKICIHDNGGYLMAVHKMEKGQMHSNSMKHSIRVAESIE